jgi:hypothetical protein
LVIARDARRFKERKAINMRALPSSVVKVATGLLILAVLASCGGSSSKSATSTPKSTSTPTATSVPELTAAEILAQASQRLAQTQSIHFKLAVTGQTFIDTNNQIQLLEASGDLIRPDRVSTEFRVKLLSSVTVSMKLITIGDKHWLTDLITGKWGPSPAEFGYDPSILFNNQEGIGPVMNRIKDARKLADGSIDGHDVFHISAVVDQTIIGPLTSYSMQGDNVAVDLWIDKSNFNLLQAQLAEPKTVTGHQPATWVLTLSNQDKPVNISPPNAPYSVSSPEASPVGSPMATPVGSPVATPVSSPPPSPEATV